MLNITIKIWTTEKCSSNRREQKQHYIFGIQSLLFKPTFKGKKKEELLEQDNAFFTDYKFDPEIGFNNVARNT